MPDLAEELRAESTAFFNAIREVMRYLVYTMGGAHYLVLVPLPDPTTGRLHSAIEQKIDALEQARFVYASGFSSVVTAGGRLYRHDGCGCSGARSQAQAGRRSYGW
jgi:hypothetical protein